jgi:PEP-CTERM/exosortase A-associated glycosyltransferase
MSGGVTTLKILHVLDHALPLQSGYVFRSLGILTEQRRIGWRTAQLVTPRQQPGEGSDTVDGWTFYRTPAPRGRLARLPVLSYLAEMRATEARIIEVARAERPDLIHAHSPALNGLPAIRAGRRLGLPVVYEVRAFWEDAAADLGRTREGGLRWRASRALETRVLRRADAVTTLCQGTRDEIVARGIPAAKVTIIPNAVDPAAFSTTRRPDPALAAQLGLSGCTVLGFIGSFYHYEGLELLVGALPAIAQAAPETRLLLVGGGPEEAAIVAQVKAMGLDHLVARTGRVPHAEVGAYYDLVDIFIYPRLPMRLTDLVTPLKPIEAMANGRIVVASDVGGHREIVRDGRTGFLFPAGQKAVLAQTVLRVLGQRADWPKVAAAARRYVETERTWQASVAGYAPVYGALVARAT